MTTTIDRPKNHLKSLIEKTENLYSIPATALKVLELTERKNIDRQRLCACIETDAALVTKLLRVVNSSLFGLSEEIVDLNHAVTLLGIEPLKLLVLGMDLPPELFEEVEASTLEQYWQQTLIKAISARELGTLLWPDECDELFIAALLQDIGTLVLVRQLGKEYAEFFDGVLSSGSSLRAVEQTALGFDHVDVTVELMRQWKLPRRVTEMINTPNIPTEIARLSDDRQSVAKVLHISQLVTELLTLPDADVTLDVLLEVGTEYHADFSFAKLQRLMILLERKIDHLADAFNVEVVDARGFEQTLLNARALLVPVAGSTDLELLDVETRHVAQGFEESLSPEEQAAEEAHAEAMNAAASRAAANTMRERAGISLIPEPRLDPQSEPPALGQRIVLSEMVTDLPFRVADSIRCCRNEKQPLTLLFLEIDEFVGFTRNHGIEASRKLLDAFISVLLSQAIELDVRLLRTSVNQFTLLLEGYDRTDGNNWVRRVVDDIRDELQASSCLWDFSTSAGLATVSHRAHQLRGDELIEPTLRCLEGAKCVSGDSAKSIEI